MVLIRAVTVKLLTDFDFLPTFRSYTDAYNYTCKTGWRLREFNGVRLHHHVYQNLRHSLPAQLCTSARIKATESLKAGRVKTKRGKKVSCPESKLCSIRLDSQSHSVWFDRKEVSILTISGRQKGVKFQTYHYFDQFKDWKRKSADLIYRKGKVLLTFIFEKTVPDIEGTSETFVGVDRGIRRIAVTSEKQFFGGGHVKNVSNRYHEQRANLQACGSRSAKRHLQRIAKKENRFRRDVNHCISKRVVQSLPVGSTIIIEDLKYIRERCKHRRDQRGEFHSWGFFQLESFLTYKAAGRGQRVLYVDPRYTSQKCSCCGHISKSNRKNQTQFRCTRCGYELNADLNAAFNIRNNYLDSIRHPSRAPVNEPVVSGHSPRPAGDLVTSR
jgi:putative transposase